MAGTIDIAAQGAQTANQQFAQGEQTGGDWAINKVKAEQTQQALQTQQQMLQLHQDEFKQELGKTDASYLQSIMGETPGSPVFKAKVAGYKSWRQSSNLPWDDVFEASLSDNKYRPDYAKMLGGLTNQTDAQKYGDALRAIHENIGKDGAVAMLPKFAEELNQQKVAGIKGEAMAKLLQTRQVPRTMGQYQKDTAPFRGFLLASDRITSQLDAAEAGKFKTPKQFVSTITAEYARGVRGAPNGGVVANEAEQDAAINAFTKDVNERLGYWLSKPQNSLPNDWAKQKRSEIGNLTDEYSKQYSALTDAAIDSNASNPTAQAAIKAYHDRIQSFIDKQSQQRAKGKQIAGAGKQPSSTNVPLEEKYAKVIDQAKTTKDQLAAAKRDKNIQKVSEIRATIDALPDDLKEFILGD